MNARRFDPFCTGSSDDPYPIYRALQDEHPVYHDEELGFWALSRFADVKTATTDWETFSNANGVHVGTGTRPRPTPGDFLDSDPPRHDQLRKIVQRHFSPKTIRAMEERIRTTVTDLIDGFIHNGQADLAMDFASLLPVTVIAGILGLPEEDHSIVHEWLDAMAIVNHDERSYTATGIGARFEMSAYFAALSAGRWREPQGDLVSHIVGAGSSGGLLIPEEIIGLFFLLVIAGHLTTASLIANSLWLLDQHPHQKKLLVDHPDRIPNAIEELLRYESPVQYLGRTTTCSIELYGQEIPAGVPLLLLYGAANRDGREFDDPDRLDLSREPKRHLAFGEGIHHCLGAVLARLEAKIALEELLARIPNYAVVKPVRWRPNTIIRGIANLHVEF
jgi:cytochrome P450